MKNNRLGYLFTFTILILFTTLAWGHPSEMGDCSVQIKNNSTEELLPEISFRWKVDNEVFSITSIVGETKFNDVRSLVTKGEVSRIQIYLGDSSYKKTANELTLLDISRSRDHKIYAQVWQKDKRENSREVFRSDVFKVKGGSCTINVRDTKVDPLLKNIDGIISTETLPVRSPPILMPDMRPLPEPVNRTE
ncbi:MAG: hypothetical protein K0R49_334 [Burkholderiales bacterium]|jgi:hypothetical protein|nr:hypothetical protein [Burkholderiales bacterium]